MKTTTRRYLTTSLLGVGAFIADAPVDFGAGHEVFVESVMAPAKTQATPASQDIFTPSTQADEYLILGNANRGAGEPMIAVNRKDPDNIVIVAMASWRDNRTGFLGTWYGRVPPAAL